jgi:hypothetical protein
MIPLTFAATHEVGTKAQIVAVVVAGIFLGVVLELVRRRRLVERYALLWMLAAVAMLALAVWRDGLKTLAHTVGIHSPPNALFLVALGVVFILLLHFSIATSRLSEETKILAQEVARLDAEARVAREASTNGVGEEVERGAEAPERLSESAPAAEAQQGEGDEPIGA